MPYDFYMVAMWNAAPVIGDGDQLPTDLATAECSGVNVEVEWYRISGLGRPENRGEVALQKVIGMPTSMASTQRKPSSADVKSRHYCGQPGR